MGFIRTVTDDLDPSMIRGTVLGFTHLEPDWSPLGDRQSHDHLLMRSNSASAIAELGPTVDSVSSLARGGVALIVDPTPPGAGRDPMRLRDLMIASGVAIMACTGAHAPPVRLARVEDRSAEYLAEWFAFEISNGMAAIVGDRFRGFPLLSERASGIAADGLNDAAVRAGAIRITLASAQIDRADGALIDAAGMTSAATGAATFLDAPSAANVERVASRFEAAGGKRHRLVLAPGTRPPDEIVDAAALGLAVVLTLPPNRAEGAIAIWDATIRGLRRHGLISQTLITTTLEPMLGKTSTLLFDLDTGTRRPELTFPEVRGDFADVDGSEWQAMSVANPLRILAVDAGVPRVNESPLR